MQVKLDLRVAIRRLVQRPAATAVAAATLALGIGGCLAMFALTDALLLRPLRFPGADRLVTLWDQGTDASQDLMGWATVADVRERSHTLVDVAAISSWMPTATGGGDAQVLEGLRVSDGFFRALGVQPAAGRLFTPQDDVRGNHHVVVLSYGLWQRRFGGAPSAVGSKIHLGGVDYAIVGVLPADFESVFATPGREVAEIWSPLAYNASLAWACRTCHHLRAIARLRPGVTLTAARAELDQLGQVLARENPNVYSAAGELVVPLQEQLFGAQRPLLLGVLGAVGLVLLMATANIAGLRFAAALPRLGELSMRRALGANRGDLIRLLTLESGLLGVLGAGLGVGVAQLALRAALSVAPPSLARLQEAAIDGRALAVAVGLSVLAALLFGALPALAATRGAPSLGRSSTAGRDRHRALATLVACDVALGVILLAGAGFFGKSLWKLLEQSPGFRSGGLLTMDLSITGERAEHADRTAAFYVDLLDKVRALPAVKDAAVATQLPMSGSVDRYSVHAEGLMNANPELDPAADRYGVSPNYLAAMGVPLLRGRALTDADRADALRVAVVSSALVKRIYGDADPLGRRVKVGGIDGQWLTIVGVVGDVRHEGLEELSAGALYMTIPQWPDPETSASLVVRAAGDPMALAGRVRDLVREIDRDVPVSRVATMDDWISARTAARRFSAKLLSAFALVALLLAALGVHGVVAMAVAARRRELGVRRALGSTDGGVLWLLLRRVLRVAGIGAAFGLVGSLLAARALRSQLYAVTPSDPSVLAMVALVLLLVACGAALGPARRALRVELSQVMREE
ncbi:MAG: ABC transporter permease [Acidobacteriota bacterium]